MTTQLWAIGLTLCACVIGAYGAVLLKKASPKVTFNLKCLANMQLLAGIALYAVGTILFIPALRGGDLSVLYPFVATTYIWISLFSIKFLKEKMNVLKWAGIVLIIIGVSFIGFGSV